MTAKTTSSVKTHVIIEQRNGNIKAKPMISVKGKHSLSEVKKNLDEKRVSGVVKELAWERSDWLNCGGLSKASCSDVEEILETLPKKAETAKGKASSPIHRGP